MKRFLILLFVSGCLAAPAHATMSAASWSSCRWTLPEEDRALGYTLSQLPGVTTCSQVKALLGKRRGRA